jgi:hypothetical protein
MAFYSKSVSLNPVGVSLLTNAPEQALNHQRLNSGLREQARSLNCRLRFQTQKWKLALINAVRPAAMWA